MSYLVFIDLIARLVAIAVAMYFLFILIFGAGYRRHAIVLVAYSFVYYKMPSLNLSDAGYLNNYIRDIEISMFIEGAAGFAMLCVLADKLSKWHALILAFAVICHTMLYCHYQGEPKWALTIAYGFYAFYDELIILVGVLQMAVSYNGFIASRDNALRGVQSTVLWVRLRYNYMYSYLFSRKESETKT